MFKNTCFYGHSEHVNFAVQGSFIASPSLLHKELIHESNRLSSRNLINQTSCLSTKVRGSYGALFRGRCYFIRNGRNPFGISYTSFDMSSARLVAVVARSMQQSKNSIRTCMHFETRLNVRETRISRDYICVRGTLYLGNIIPGETYITVTCRSLAS